MSRKLLTVWTTLTLRCTVPLMKTFTLSQLNVLSWQVELEDNERFGFEGMEASM